MKYPDDFINKVIIGNHLEIMPFIPDEVIDLTVTSPPYDNLRDYQGYDFKFEPLAKELYRVTKQGGVVVWVVGDATIDGSETGTSFRQALYFKKVGFNLGDTMIWQKQNPFNFGSNYFYPQSFEYMFIFTKSKIKTYNLIRDRKIKNVGKKFRQRRRGRNDFMESDNKEVILQDIGKRYNIWTIPVQNYKNHPATFPEKLARDHILSWSNPSDIVLDPMCGSGTTCKMAKQHNRKYIGIDLGYKELAEERITGAGECRSGAPYAQMADIQATASPHQDRPRQT